MPVPSLFKWHCQMSSSTTSPFGNVINWGWVLNLKKTLATWKSLILCYFIYHYTLSNIPAGCSSLWLCHSTILYLLCEKFMNFCSIFAYLCFCCCYLQKYNVESIQNMVWILCVRPMIWEEGKKAYFSFFHIYNTRYLMT